MTLLCAIFLALAGYLWGPQQPKISSHKERRTSRIDPRVLLVVIATASAVVIIPALWWLSAIAGILTLCIGWLIIRSARSKARASRQEDVSMACSALAAQLRAGAIPSRAVTKAAAANPILSSAKAANEIGSSIPAALATAGAQPGAEDLVELARSWQICERTGAQLAPAVQRVTLGLRSTAAARRTVDAELASARATGRLLALLPALGLVFGFTAGGNPIKFLAGSALGNVCLVLAVALASVGLYWTEKLADGVANEVVAK